MELRTPVNNRPEITHILNGAARGPADDASPQFAAAALALHVPFGNAEDLLSGKHLHSD